MSNLTHLCCRSLGKSIRQFLQKAATLESLSACICFQILFFVLGLVVAVSFSTTAGKHLMYAGHFCWLPRSVNQTEKSLYVLDWPQQGFGSISGSKDTSLQQKQTAFGSFSLLFNNSITLEYLAHVLRFSVQSPETSTEGLVVKCKHLKASWVFRNIFEHKSHQKQGHEIQPAGKKTDFEYCVFPE